MNTFTSQDVNLIATKVFQAMCDSADIDAPATMVEEIFAEFVESVPAGFESRREAWAAFVEVINDDSLDSEEEALEATQEEQSNIAETIIFDFMSIPQNAEATQGSQLAMF